MPKSTGDASASMVGSDFAALIKAATKFPSVGAFAGSELVNLQIGDGVAQASCFGAVLAIARHKGEGTLPLVGLDERVVKPFASVCSSAKQVTVELKGQEVRFRARKREITLPFKAGSSYKLPKLTSEAGVSKTLVTQEIAEEVRYLAQLAFNDSSRAELCCVMLLKDGRAMACSQKVVGVFRCDAKAEKIAMPLPLARELTKDDKIYAGVKETVIRNGIAWYCMPSPVKAQKEFPVDTIAGYSNTKRKVLIECKGSRLTQVLTEADAIIGAVSRTEIVAVLKSSNQHLELATMNGGARFNASIPAISLSGDFEIRLPLEELMHVTDFLSKADKLSVSVGANGEVYIEFGRGWLMFSAWKAK